MLFAELDIPAIMALSIPILGVCIALFGVLSSNWRKTKIAEYRAVMVQNMIEKGFSPSEIERVLAAADMGSDKIAAMPRSRRHDSEYAR